MTSLGPSSARAIIAIAINELRRIAHDRVALFFALVLPVVIITIIGVTFSGSARVDLGIVDRDSSDRSTALIDTLRATEGLDLKRYGSLDELRRDIRSGGLNAGVVVPAGYGAKIDGGGQAAVDLVAEPTSSAGAAVRSTIEGAVADEAALTAAARFAADHGVDDPDRAAELATQMAADQTPVTVRTTAIGGGRAAGLGSFDYTAPSNLVLFVFINTLVVGSMLARDRQQGITQRMLATPHGTGTILAGIGAAKLLFAVTQSALIVVIGAVAFGVDWGDPLGVALVVVIWAAMSTAVGLTVGTIVSDPEQAQAVGIPVAVGLAMLGGCMWPLEIVPNAMQAVGHLTPHAWAMDAWIGLIFDRESVAAIAPQLVVLTGFTAVLGVVATYRLRAVLTR